MTRVDTESLVAHVDLDAFFASVEQRDNPDYRDKPVVVGAIPGGRGVVAACSYEARVYGIHSAMPIGEAYRRCPDAIYVRPNIKKYAEVSREIMRILDEISPVVEKASIDEAYIDISGLENLSGSPRAIGQSIRDKIFAATDLTASVGIGPNRLIAKLGSEACKPDGLKVIAQSQVLDFLAPMPVKNLRGMGKRTLAKIADLNISTIAELRELPLELLESCVGKKAAASFQRQAFGNASVHVETDRRRKSISKETTFSTDVSDTDYLHDTLRELAREVARTARREGLSGRVVNLKIRYPGFETHTRQLSLDKPTHDERLMVRIAWRLFNDQSLPKKPVRLIGIGISDWSEPDPQPQQNDLFNEKTIEDTDENLLATIDKVTDKYGKPLVQIGVNKSKY